MTTFVALQNTYEEIELALCKDQQLIDIIRIPKALASQDIVMRFAELIARNNLTLSDLSFLAVNQGPGPFTTLRVIITTANGLSFARKLPLIGVDGLKTLLHENSDSAYPITCALLNAFNDDLYCALESQGEIVEISCKKSGDIFKELMHRFEGQPIRFIGNGAMLFRAQILAVFGAHAFIPDELPLTCSITSVALCALKTWAQGDQVASTQLLPLYLKQLLPASK